MDIKINFPGVKLQEEKKYRVLIFWKYPFVSAVYRVGKRGIFYRPLIYEYELVRLTVPEIPYVRDKCAYFNPP